MEEISFLSRNAPRIAKNESFILGRRKFEIANFPFTAILVLHIF